MATSWWRRGVCDCRMTRLVASTCCENSGPTSNRPARSGYAARPSRRGTGNACSEDTPGIAALPRRAWKFPLNGSRRIERAASSQRHLQQGALWRRRNFPARDVLRLGAWLAAADRGPFSRRTSGRRRRCRERHDPGRDRSWPPGENLANAVQALRAQRGARSCTFVGDSVRKIWNGSPRATTLSSRRSITAATESRGYLAVNEDLLCLLGFYLAEGSASDRGGVRFAIGNRQRQAWCPRCRRAPVRVFGRTAADLFESSRRGRSEARQSHCLVGLAAGIRISRRGFREQEDSGSCIQCLRISAPRVSPRLSARRWNRFWHSNRVLDVIVRPSQRPHVPARIPGRRRLTDARWSRTASSARSAARPASRRAAIGSFRSVLPKS